MERLTDSIRSIITWLQPLPEEQSPPAEPQIGLTRRQFLRMEWPADLEIELEPMPNIGGEQLPNIGGEQP